MSIDATESWRGASKSVLSLKVHQKMAGKMTSKCPLRQIPGLDSRDLACTCRTSFDILALTPTRMGRKLRKRILQAIKCQWGLC